MAKGTRPGHLPAPSKARHGERVCEIEGCETQLSVYNLTDRCWHHADVVFPSFRGKRLRIRRS